MKVKITKKDAFTGDATPKYWGPLAPYMCGILENPKADDDAKRFVTNEFQRLAKLVDKYNDATWDREERVKGAKFELNSLRCILEQFRYILKNYKGFQEELDFALKRIKSLEDFVEGK